MAKKILKKGATLQQNVRRLTIEQDNMLVILRVALRSFDHLVGWRLRFGRFIVRR